MVSGFTGDGDCARAASWQDTKVRVKTTAARAINFFTMKPQGTRSKSKAERKSLHRKAPAVDGASLVRTKPAFPRVRIKPEPSRDASRNRKPAAPARSGQSNPPPAGRNRRTPQTRRGY